MLVHYAAYKKAKMPVHCTVVDNAVCTITTMQLKATFYRQKYFEGAFPPPPQLVDIDTTYIATQKYIYLIIYIL